jgi:hypothetical protein
MKCAEARVLFSPYLDGVVNGHQMRDLGEHLTACNQCSGQYRLLGQTQQAVASLGRKKAPPELEWKLRVAMSQSMTRQRPFAALQVRWENALNAFMVPATAGMLSAIVFFGLLIGFFALPGAGNDVPTMLYTPPTLSMSPFSASMESVNADSIVVEAYVDANGRVQDYRILSAPDNAHALRSELENMLIFTVFHPATAFGRPTAGRAVLSFSNINVKG